MDNYIIIDGEKYIEITDRAIDNVKPGQFVNRFGTIYTPANMGKHKFRHPTEGLRYLNVYIYLNDGNIYRTNMHRLIMLVFKYQDGCKNLVVNHIDGNRYNNSFDNLEWCTTADNNRHAIDTGLVPLGENHHCSKLTAKEVEEICKELEKPRYYGQLTKLANKYNVSECNINRIAQGKTWKEISKKYNIDYSAKAICVDSILTREQIVEICKELSNGRYRGDIVDIAKRYNVAPSTIAGIAERKTWTDISKDYSFPNSTINKLSIDQIHQICKIIQDYGYLDSCVLEVISEELNLNMTDNMRRNIRRLYRRDKDCYFNITSQYNWKII